MSKRREGRAYRAGYTFGYWFGGPALTLLLIALILGAAQLFAEAAH